MAPPTTPGSTPSSSRQPTGKPPVPVPMDTDDEEEVIAPASHEAEVRKLERHNKRLGDEFNKLAEASHRDAVKKQGQIDSLNDQVKALMDKLERLTEASEKQTSLYRDHIENLASNSATGKDAGEILKPRQPDPYDGSAAALQGFLTQLRAYQLYYPTQFVTSDARVRHATGFLKDKALRWFEPVMRDYVNHVYADRKEETRAIYGSYEVFEHELKSAFGLQDEKRAAEQQIQKLHQKGAASTYAAEHRNLASRLNWGEEGYMASFYKGLKSDVKDAMVGKAKPTTYNGLVQLAVEIDDQQFERRQEKKAEKSGGSYTPQWKNRGNHANHGKKRQTDTSYGTDSGPMNLGMVKKDYSKVLCWNCGVPGHTSRKCRKPKTDQQFKPVPEGKKKVGWVGQQEEEPPMGKKTVAMARAGYDNTGISSNEITPLANEELKSEETLKSETYEEGKPSWKTEKERQAPLEDRWKGMTSNINNISTLWTPVPLPTRKKEERPPYGTIRKIGMVRKGKEIRKKDTFKYVRPTVEVTDEEDDIPDRQPAPETPPIVAAPCEGTTKISRQQQTNDEIRRKYYLRKEGEPSISAGAEARQARRLGLPITDKDVLAPADEYFESSDSGSIDDTSEEESVALQLLKQELEENTPDFSPGKDGKSERMLKQLVERTSDAAEGQPIYVRAIRRKDLTETGDHTGRAIVGDEPSLHPRHPRHIDVSWISCTYHACLLHRFEKLYHDCYPVRTVLQPLQRFYDGTEARDYRVAEWFEGMGVAQLELRNNFYPEECVEKGSTINNCVTEECCVHEREKVQLWHGPLECPANHAMNCSNRKCLGHAEYSRAIHERIHKMHKDGFDFKTRTGGELRDRLWYEEIRKHAKNDTRRL